MELTPRGQLGSVWAGNGEGGALGGLHVGWAGALLPFNHSPVTCPKREAKAACPHPCTLGRGLGMSWGRAGAWGGLMLPPQDAGRGSWSTLGSAKPSWLTLIKSHHFGFLLCQKRIRTSWQIILKISTQWGASLNGWLMVAG